MAVKSTWSENERPILCLLGSGLLSGVLHTPYANCELIHSESGVGIGAAGPTSTSESPMMT